MLAFSLLQIMGEELWNIEMAEWMQILPDVATCDC